MGKAPLSWVWLDWNGSTSRSEHSENAKRSSSPAPVMRRMGTASWRKREPDRRTFSIERYRQRSTTTIDTTGPQGIYRGNSRKVDGRDPRSSAMRSGNEHKIVMRLQ